MADYEFAINLAGKPADPANGRYYDEARAAIRIGYQNDLVDYDQIDPNNPQEGLDYQRYDPLVVVCDETSCTLDPSTGKLRALDLYAHAGHYGEWDGNATLTAGAVDGFATDSNGRMHLPWPGLYKLEWQLQFSMTHTLDAQGAPGKGALIAYSLGGTVIGRDGDSGIIAVAAGTMTYTTPLMVSYHDTADNGFHLDGFSYSSAAYAPSDDGTYALTFNPTSGYLKATWIAPPSDGVNHPYYEIPS